MRLWGALQWFAHLIAFTFIYTKHACYSSGFPFRAVLDGGVKHLWRDAIVTLSAERLHLFRPKPRTHGLKVCFDSQPYLRQLPFYFVSLSPWFLKILHRSGFVPVRPLMTGLFRLSLCLLRLVTRWRGRISFCNAASSSTLCVWWFMRTWVGWWRLLPFLSFYSTDFKYWPCVFHIREWNSMNDVSLW